MKSKTLSIAHSPDPDDAFMFYGIAKGKLPSLKGWRIRHVLKDIQSLNHDAELGRHLVTAISTAAYPSVSDRYWILSVGASVGRKYGPLVVTRPEKRHLFRQKKWDRLKIGTPGPQTTALLLLKLLRPKFISVDRPFDKIIGDVIDGKLDGGLIIHEGQLTYRELGLVKVVDLGQWWHQETKLPIPLGLDVVRKDVGKEGAQWIADLLQQSIRLAYKEKKKSVNYALQYGRGLDAQRGEKFVKMYVNQDTMDMGSEGERALKKLFLWGHRRGLYRRLPTFEIIRPSSDLAS